MDITPGIRVDARVVMFVRVCFAPIAAANAWAATLSDAVNFFRGDFLVSPIINLLERRLI